MFSYDAQAALGFLLSQTSHIETKVNAKVYPEIQYTQLVPVDISANPFTKTVTYFSSDKFGAADWINLNSNDIPMAGTELEKHETPVHSAAIGYGFGYEELQQAQRLGIALTSDDAMAARRAYEEMVDRVALYGDATKGFQGMFNHGAVTPQGATFGGWAAATEDQILKDINDAIMSVGTDTRYTSYANTIVLPYEMLSLLATVRLGDTQTTILDFIMSKNVYTATTGQALTIRAAYGLETAGAGGTQRMIAYRYDEDVLKLHIPMPHTFLPAWQSGPMTFTVPGIFRLGGVDIRRPLEVRYVDGI